MESLEDEYLQVYAEKLDPMDFGKSKRTAEEKKKSRDKVKIQKRRGIIAGIDMKTRTDGYGKG